MDDTGKYDICFVCKKTRHEHQQGKLCEVSVAALEKAMNTPDEPRILPNGDAIVKTEFVKLKAQPSVGNTDFKEDCFTLRDQMKFTEGQLMQVFHDHPVFSSVTLEHQTVEPQRSEMRANLMLAFRHLEDARMRLGKAIQAYDGGTSCY